jgi:hypothetical protein
MVTKGPNHGAIVCAVFHGCIVHFYRELMGDFLAQTGTGGYATGNNYGFGLILVVGAQ